ncbi:MAG: hypothetical protein JW706_00065 [Opitutales bacterium]|nr:hypothetical protein [Opitutales bacterium]
MRGATIEKSLKRTLSGILEWIVVLAFGDALNAIVMPAWRDLLRMMRDPGVRLSRFALG